MSTFDFVIFIFFYLFFLKIAIKRFEIWPWQRSWLGIFQLNVFYWEMFEFLQLKFNGIIVWFFISSWKRKKAQTYPFEPANHVRHKKPVGTATIQIFALADSSWGIRLVPVKWVTYSSNYCPFRLHHSQPLLIEVATRHKLPTGKRTSGQSTHWGIESWGSGVNWTEKSWNVLFYR